MKNKKGEMATINTLKAEVLNKFIFTSSQVFRISHIPKSLGQVMRENHCHCKQKTSLRPPDETEMGLITCIWHPYRLYSVENIIISFLAEKKKSNKTNDFSFLNVHRDFAASLKQRTIIFQTRCSSC